MRDPEIYSALAPAKGQSASQTGAPDSFILTARAAAADGANVRERNRRQAAQGRGRMELNRERKEGFFFLPLSDR